MEVLSKRLLIFSVFDFNVGFNLHTVKFNTRERLFKRTFLIYYLGLTDLRG